MNEAFLCFNVEIQSIHLVRFQTEENEIGDTYNGMTFGFIEELETF